MNMKTLAKLFALSSAAICLGAISGLADGEHCRQVGGGVLTNFLDPSQCLPTAGSTVNLCTDGTATGDLKGAIEVQVAGISKNGNVFTNHHHWVTESGDTIFLNTADLTIYPTPDNHRVLADYLNGVEVMGGTGAFERGTGTIFFFGAGDLSLGQITLRYEGTVCFPKVKEHKLAV